ncbi:HD-GYP domain-containing protein [Evansella sp. AB-P1]|uniref:HD-GYP domain-containing protein n=1 Tax=Evansella sp. AB-P1 TaxID=3037653 RepID=UPI00241D7C67|nr:HD-GYP domain-containing protein [Evansella sp. AB-P1]MDG5788913.1 HD-GYP domain-containing protein [Evansella sp. AB-P1]
MRIRSVHSLKENDCLGKAIYNENDSILLNQGVSLTKRMIERLKEKGVSFVYIDDKETEGIITDDVIKESTKQESIRTIKENFTNISQSLKLGKTIDMDKLSPTFSNVVNNILSDIHSNKEAVSMLSDVFCYDTYVFQHSLNVTIYSLALGKKYGLSEKQLEELGLGAILHDIGKVAIPIEVLNKEETLTFEEFALIKEHTNIGFDMLRKAHTISLLTAHCAFQHHERLDGSGYPRGIKGDDIHIYAKIIGIADVFDAVTGNRVYRKAKLPNEGLELLYSGAATMFDKEMVEAFSKTVAIYPIGLEVALSDGRMGVVSKQNGDFTSRPVIRILSEEGKQVTPYELNLMEHLSITITSCETALTQNKVTN